VFAHEARCACRNSALRQGTLYPSSTQVGRPLSVPPPTTRAGFTPRMTSAAREASLDALPLAGAQAALASPTAAASGQGSASTTLRGFPGDEDQPSCGGLLPSRDAVAIGEPLPSGSRATSDASDSEGAADALGLALLSMRGRALSAAKVDCLLRNLTQDCFSPSLPRTKFHNLRALRKHREGLEGGALERSGFVRRVVQCDAHGSDDTDGLSDTGSIDGGSVPLPEDDLVPQKATAEVWSRDAADILRSQIEGAVEDSDFILWPKAEWVVDDESSDVQSERAFSHPMNADLAVEACKAVQRVICSSKDPKTYWSFGEGGQPVSITALALYSDKSAMSASALAKTFYPLHAIWLNSSEAYRQKIIASVRSIVAYLPTTLLDEGLGESSRLLEQIALHKCISIALEPFQSRMLEGLLASTAGGLQLKMHLVLGAYLVAD
jgi:Plavaka transposase